MTERVESVADAGCTHLARADPMLGSLIERAGPFAMNRITSGTLVSYLVRSIIYQQLHGTAAAAIHGRLLEYIGSDQPTPSQLLSIDPETMRSLGVSANKARSLHDLAARAADGGIHSIDELEQLSDDEIVSELTAVRGIGPWTVHMLLMFRLGRPDVLPTGDFGVREGFKLEHGLAKQPTPGELSAAAKPWRPYRSIASWYLWRAVDLHRQPKAT